MSEIITVMGEAARKNPEKIINEGGFPGVSGKVVNSYGFDVNREPDARAWLLRELEKQRCRESLNIAFESDDGNEKQRFAANRRAYFERYGVDFVGAPDNNLPWEDTRPEAAGGAVEEAASDVASGGASGELKRLRDENAALRAELDELRARVEGLITRLEGPAGGAVGADPNTPWNDTYPR